MTITLTATIEVSDMDADRIADELILPISEQLEDLETNYCEVSSVALRSEIT